MIKGNKPKLPRVVRDQLLEEIKLDLSLDATRKQVMHRVRSFLQDKGFKPISDSQIDKYINKCRVELVEDIKALGRVNINKSINKFIALKKACVKKGDLRGAIKCEEHIAKISGLLDDTAKNTGSPINITYVNASDMAKVGDSKSSKQKEGSDE